MNLLLIGLLGLAIGMFLSRNKKSSSLLWKKIELLYKQINAQEKAIKILAVQMTKPITVKKESTYNDRLKKEIMHLVDQNKGMTAKERDQEMHRAYKQLVHFLASVAMG